MKTEPQGRTEKSSYRTCANRSKNWQGCSYLWVWAKYRLIWVKMIVWVYFTSILHVKTYGTLGGHFRVNVHFLKSKWHFYVKMTAKYHIGLDMQNRSKAHPYDHFNPYKSILRSISQIATALPIFRAICTSPISRFFGSVLRFGLQMSSRHKKFINT